MNLDHLTEELEEFEDFVNSYAQQMDEIVNGKLPDSPAELARPSKNALNVTSDRSKNASVALTEALENIVAPPDKAVKKKIPKTSLDYSRFELIDEGVDEDKSKPTNKPTMRSEPTKTKKKPYSLRTNHAGKSDKDKVMELSKQSKDLGNEAIKVLDASSAISYYTQAINLCLKPARDDLIRYDFDHRPKASDESKDPFGFLNKFNLSNPEPIEPEASLYTNRAFARICVKDYSGAIEDCDVVVSGHEQGKLCITENIEPVMTSGL
ncbi:hypothetical protein BC830DRAFT_1169646 [Chytriomyces sp. MP71]|nr:hypothetical protein BC830DRAFT_1169646 [Chytriomyces sp. MP71]